MFNARNFIPLPPAFAAGMVTRVGDSLLWTGVLDLAPRPASYPIYRGVER